MSKCSKCHPVKYTASPWYLQGLYIIFSKKSLALYSNSAETKNRKKENGNISLLLVFKS